MGGTSVTFQLHKADNLMAKLKDTVEFFEKEYHLHWVKDARIKVNGDIVTCETRFEK